jgi:hypothetical protein
MKESARRAGKQSVNARIERARNVPVLGIDWSIRRRGTLTSAKLAVVGPVETTVIGWPCRLSCPVTPVRSGPR